MAEISGKVVLVTGGGSGLGEATCRVLAEAGARVLVAELREEHAERVAAEIRATGGAAAALPLDVSDETGAAAAIDRAVQAHGQIDVLVNNAGMDVTKSVEELSLAEWDRVLGVNLRGPFVMSKLIFPRMREQGSGYIVNIVSTAAKRAWANASAYHASKWGLLGLSYALHVEARPHNVKVTALVAGGMRTPFLLDRFPDIDVSTLQEPRNVAETIRFLLLQPAETVIPELLVLPMRETSWP